MIEINALGDVCPIPVIKAKNALKNMSVGEMLTISVDNKIATENLKKLAEQTGSGYTMETLESDNFRVSLTKKIETIYEQNGDDGDNMIVVVSSDKMGDGHEELGKVLIKSFLYALTELETAPQAVIFYNGGARLTTEGSDSIEDLKKLEEKGSVIMTCGTCLNYYGLSEKLAIGQVSNMYDIVEKMAAASKIIRP